MPRINQSRYASPPHQQMSKAETRQLLARIYEEMEIATFPSASELNGAGWEKKRSFYKNRKTNRQSPNRKA